MNKFETSRTHSDQATSKKFKKPIPIVYVDPIQTNENTCIFIFCCGLGGTNSFNIYLNNDIYNTNYFVMYDKMGHGDNLNKPSQYVRRYITELDCVVNWAKNKFPNKRIYLLGESWGCAINFLYYKKYLKKVNGVINWNMPTKPVSPRKKTAWQTWQFFWREFITLVTNINLTLPIEQNNNALLTRNQLLIRAMAMMPTTRNSTKLTLAVWKFMYPSYHFLKKNCNSEKYNFLYVQSGQDNLMTKKHIDKIELRADSNHYLKVPTGYHILTMEPEESKILYRAIQDFINKK